MTVAEDLVAQYEAAKELAEGIEAAWKAEGSPLTTEGGATGKAVVTHPLVTLMQIARRDVVKFGKIVKPAHRGSEPSAVVTARIGKSPAAKLRVAK